MMRKYNSFFNFAHHDAHFYPSKYGLSILLIAHYYAHIQIF